MSNPLDSVLKEITDAQSAEIILRVPWSLGDLNGDGEASYSEEEVTAIVGHVRKLNERAGKAEEINAVLSEKLSDMIVANGQALACSPAVRIEVDRLRAQNESLRDQLDEAIAQINSMWKTIAP